MDNNTENLLKNSKQSFQQLKITFNSKKLSTRKAKVQYLTKILKDTNPGFWTQENVTTQDLLLHEIHLFSNQKQSVCLQKMNEMKKLSEQFDLVGQFVKDQKQLTTKYEQKIDLYLLDIQNQAKTQLNTKINQRILKQNQFVQKINQKLKKIMVDIRQKNQFTTSKKVDQNIEDFQNITKKMTKLKSKINQSSIEIKKDQSNFANTINNKILDLKKQFNQIKISLNKLQSLYSQLKEFQIFIKNKITQMKEQRLQNEQNFIEIMDKIVFAISKNKNQD